MRGARLLRRGFCLLQQRGNQLQAGPGQRSSVKEYDAERFGGWKSAEMLFGDKGPRQSVIGRADWHIMQFLIAMVPPGLVLLLVQWARYDMRRLEEQKTQEMLEKESQKLRAVAEHQQKQAQQMQGQKQQQPQQQAGEGSAPSSSSGGGGSDGSPAAAPAGAATGAAAAAGGEAVEQRLARLEALVQALQQARQGGAGHAPQDQGAATQALQQPTVQAVGLDQGGHQAAAAEEWQDGETQPGPSGAQRVAGALRWAGSWVAFGRQRQPAEAGSGEEAGSPAATSEPAAVRDHSSSGGGGSSSGDSSSSSQGAAAVSMAKAAATASGPLAPGVAAAPEAAPPAVRQPGNAANWLLHAAGQPLRWLRSKPRPTEMEGAEEERRLRRWLHQSPEESD